MIIRGTTPTETLTINGRDLSDAKVYVTYQQGDVAFTLEGDEVKKTVSDGNTVLSVALTQKDTLSLAPGAVLVQIGWITAVHITPGQAPGIGENRKVLSIPCEYPKV